MPKGIPRKSAGVRTSRSAIDMTKLSSVDLIDIADKAHEMAASKVGEEREALKAEVTALVEKRGFTIKSLFSKRPYAQKSATSQSVKNTTRAEPGRIYVNPGNKEDVYRGRGRRPEWLQVWMQKHGEDFSALGRKSSTA